ncbi:O-Antigen ligase [bacterium BMS3Bbin06]|nr:O-Antigen ligase [bacterium BMS3Abin08]GBE34540.1 O-Antigen ligase [bacterium BMS3Bbin06]
MIKSYRLYIFLLIFTPLAFGTVEAWSLTVMEVTAVAAFLLLLIDIRKNRVSYYHTPGVVPLLLLLVVIVFQMIPLPPSLVKVISGADYSVYDHSAGIVKPLRWMPLTVDRKATLLEFFRFLSYVLFYILTVQLLSRKKLLKRTLTVLVVFFSALSLFAILQYLLFNNRIYWVRELTQGGAPYGPYVNRNHYAGLMEMLFPLIVGMFLYYKPVVTYTTFREKIAEVFNQPRTNIYILLGFSSVLIATSIFLSLSRGGIISLSLSMVFFGLLLIGNGRMRKRGVVMLLVFFVVLITVGWFGWEPIFERFEKIRTPEGQFSEQRLVIWRDSAGIIKDFFLTGSGFGSFVDIYPSYRTLSGGGIADHAHNDYIELLTSGGIVSFLLFFWFVLGVLCTSFRRFRKRRDWYSRYLFMGAVSGVVAILIHSLSDFNLQIGANGLYFFFLMGLAVAVVNTRFLNGGEETYLEEKELKIGGPLIIAVSLMLFLSVLINSGILAGKAFFASIRNIQLSDHLSGKQVEKIRTNALKAAMSDPLEARYRYAAAQSYLLKQDMERAMDFLYDAIKLSPLKGEYLQTTGFVLMAEGRKGEGERLLSRGVEVERNNPLMYLRYASRLFSEGRRSLAGDVVRRALVITPEKTGEFVTMMVLNGLKDKEILGILPELSVPFFRFGEYLENTGRSGLAEVAYRRALESAKKEGRLRPDYFYRIYRFYLKRGDRNVALEVMKDAVEEIPDTPGLRLTLAAEYERLGITYRAMEEYKKVLILDPSNRRARKAIERLSPGSDDP